MEKNDLEPKIRSIGSELYSAISGVPPVFDSRRWTGRVMDLAMQNEEFKLRLFRFIDVLPSLGTDARVISILREYLGEGAGMPEIISRGIGLIPGKGFIPRLAAPLVTKSVEFIARQFIAGSSPGATVRTLQSLQKDGTLFTVDLLGEIVVSDREAKAYAARYLDLLDLLSERFPGSSVDVSLKVSSFYSQLDPADREGSIEKAKEGIRPVLQRAKEYGISVTFDMEHAHLKSLTIAIFKNILEEEEFRALPAAGIALQAYLKDSEKDVRELLGWARERKRKISVRLVKGAYWDYEVAFNRRNGWPVPVFLNKQETDRSFEDLTRRLLEQSDVVRPALATHNLRSIAHALAVSGHLGIPTENFEFQMLYGMAEPLRQAVRRSGFPVRVYVPVGELIPGMAYLVRRLLENTANLSFLRRSFGEKASFEELIKPPDERIQALPGNSRKDEFRNEPLLDFSLADNRTNIAQALSIRKDCAGGSYPLLIGGRRIRTSREIVSRNPARPAQVVGRVSSASREEAEEAIREAVKVRDRWRRTPPEERAGYLFKTAEAMRRQRFDLMALEVLEAGKTWMDADGDVAEAIDYLEYYGREMVRLGRPRKMGDYPGEENEYRYEPRGIGVVIAPWNFPLAIAAGMTSAALVAGNCVIFKPSGLAPVAGFRLCELFLSAGLPPGVLQFLPGPGSDVGEYLVSHPRVDVIAFTGSKEVGARIMQLAAETHPGQRSVKKVIAELGGKNAIIVDETADLDEAVTGIVESAFGYQGQKCSACSRLIAVGFVFDELLDRLVQATSSLRIGPTEDPGNRMGPMIDEAALNKVRTYIEIGRQEGKQVLEMAAPGEGFFIGPTVFTDVKPESRIASEEIFGPVLSVLRAADIDEAIVLANRSVYALTGGLFSRSPENIRKAKEGFMTGNLYINRRITGALVGRQPFGGFGMSGIGSKAGGPDYLLQFMNPVTVSENTIRRGFAPID